MGNLGLPLGWIPSRVKKRIFQKYKVFTISQVELDFFPYTSESALSTSSYNNKIRTRPTYVYNTTRRPKRARMREPRESITWRRADLSQLAWRTRLSLSLSLLFIIENEERINICAVCLPERERVLLIFSQPPSDSGHTTTLSDFDFFVSPLSYTAFTFIHLFLSLSRCVQLRDNKRNDFFPLSLLYIALLFAYCVIYSSLPLVYCTCYTCT